MSARFVRAALVLLALPAACAPQAPQSHADAITAETCRKRVEAVYNVRNPGQVYNQDNYLTSTRDAPFGTSGTIGVTSRGLGGEYQRQQMLSDCIKGQGTIGPTPAAPPEDQGE
ncbi:MAG: hypothetical protein J0I21_00350 [Alphaproteobacteria bacterium]|mgnify:CR=1 FL=1|nr:hypothetical protein [Alphaproteobacteria bacterium]